MANPLTVVLLASAQKAASGNGAEVDVSLDDDLESTYQRGGAKLQLDITAVEGTDPTLDVVVETSPSGGADGSWETVGTFTQAAAVGHQRLAVAGLERFVRCSWTIGGEDTPKFTFALGGTALTIYATPADLGSLSIAAAVLTNATANDKAKALISSTDKCSSFIGNSHKMPLVSWGDDVRQSCSDIALYHVINSIVGHRPGPLDESIKDRHDEALEWLKLVSAGHATPDGMVDDTPDTYEGGAYVYSAAKRGW